MKYPPRCVLTLLALMLPLAAMAHPTGHDDEKAIPTTCAQLADTARFTNDESYPQIKALRIRCDAANPPAPADSDAKAPERKAR